MIPNIRPSNVVRGIVSDVAGDVLSNVSQAQPVTAQGLQDSLKSSATNRVQQEIPMVQPIANSIKGSIQGGNRTKTNNTQKGRKSGKGNGKSGGNKGGGKGKYTGGTQQMQSPQSNTSSYGNIDHGQLYTIQSEKDTSYWTDILQDQSITSDTNTSRTALTIIKTGHNDVLQPGLSSKLQTAYSSIYMQKLNEAIGSTGGNASIKNSFTEANFWKHQRYAFSACIMLAEIYTLRAWNPPESETNTVIRQFKNALCSSTELMDATNRLEEAVAQYALPPEAIKSAISYMQTYKKSPVSGGVHCRLMSTALFNDLRGGDGFNLTISELDSLSDLMTDTSWTQDNSTITSLLIHKCNGFVSCRAHKVGAQYPTYQMDMNAILDNMRFSWDNGGTDYISNEPLKSDSLNVAFPFNVNEIPKHVSSSLLLRYELFGSNGSGFPWFIQKSEAQASRYIGLNNNTLGFNVQFSAVSSEFRDITDNSYSINSTNDAGYFKPIGLNTQVFQPTYPIVVNATRDVLYNTYSMPSMS